MAINRKGVMMKRTLLALCAIAAITAVSPGVASAQGYDNDQGGMSAGPGHDQGFQERGFSERGERCHIVISHRRGPNGSVTVRRRICE